MLEDKSPLSFDRLIELSELPDDMTVRLAELAHEVRLAWCGPEVELEGIVSAKTGGCPEDCNFCGQSATSGAGGAGMRATPLLEPDEVMKAALEAQQFGASEFCIVLAVRGPDERTLRRLVELVHLVRDGTSLNVNVSAGILADEQAEQLAAAGVHRYNHNLETARSFFGSVVTTHSWHERAETCRAVRKAGMELCCGGLIGMGETPRQRVELICEIRSMDPSEVPVNFLNPRPGTPLEAAARVGAMEAIRWISLFRLGMPGVILRYAGGREITLGDLQAMGMKSGINALIIGNYLTTLGRAPEEDLEMLRELQMPIGTLSRVL